MRPLRPAATIAGLAATALLAACGSSTSSSGGGQSGQTARQAVLASITSASATSLRYDISGSGGVDSSSLKNVPSNLAGAITGAFGSASSLTVAGRAEQESAVRYKVTIDLKPAVAQTVTGVAYDGTFFYSLDGGRIFGSGGSLQSLTGVGITPTDVGRLLGTIDDQSFKDLGQASLDGRSTEHYSVALTVDTLVKALAAPTSPGATPSAADQQNLAAIAQLLSVDPSSIDVYTQADGHLAGYGVSLNFGIDVGKLAGLFGGGATSGASPPSGRIAVKVDVASRVTDYGSAITITRPTVSPGAPRLPTGIGGGFFGG